MTWNGKLITDYIKVNNHIYSTNTSSFLIKGADWGYAGPSLELYAPQYSNADIQGGFDLSTNLGNDHPEGNHKLKGRADGTLVWRGNDLAGSAIVSKSISTNGYITYASGLILQWGYSNAITNGSNIYYPISFPIYSLNVVTSAGVITSTYSNSSFKVDDATRGFSWFAIGY